MTTEEFQQEMHFQRPVHFWMEGNFRLCFKHNTSTTIAVSISVQARHTCHTTDLSVVRVRFDLMLAFFFSDVTIHCIEETFQKIQNRASSCDNTKKKFWIVFSFDLDQWLRSILVLLSNWMESEFLTQQFQSKQPIPRLKQGTSAKLQRKVLCSCDITGTKQRGFCVVKKWVKGSSRTIPSCQKSPYCRQRFVPRPSCKTKNKELHAAARCETPSHVQTTVLIVRARPLSHFFFGPSATKSGRPYGVTYTCVCVVIIIVQDPSPQPWTPHPDPRPPPQPWTPLLWLQTPCPETPSTMRPLPLPYPRPPTPDPPP